MGLYFYLIFFNHALVHTPLYQSIMLYYPLVVEFVQNQESQQTPSSTRFKALSPEAVHTRLNPPLGPSIQDPFTPPKPKGHNAETNLPWSAFFVALGSVNVLRVHTRVLTKNNSSKRRRAAVGATSGAQRKDMDLI